MLRRFSGPATGRNFTPSGAHGIAVLVALAWFGLTARPLAHEGHEDAPAPAATAGLPRLATTSDAYELVAVVDGERLTIYLDRFADNAPITDAGITVTINDETAAA